RPAVASARGLSGWWTRAMLESHTAMLTPEAEDAAHRGLLRERRCRSERCANHTCTQSENFGQLSIPSPGWVTGPVDGRPPRIEYEMFLGTLSKELGSRPPPRAASGNVCSPWTWLMVEARKSSSEGNC